MGKGSAKLVASPVLSENSPWPRRAGESRSARNDEETSLVQAVYEE